MGVLSRSSALGLCLISLLATTACGSKSSSLDDADAASQIKLKLESAQSWLPKLPAVSDPCREFVIDDVRVVDKMISDKAATVKAIIQIRSKTDSGTTMALYSCYGWNMENKPGPIGTMNVEGSYTFQLWDSGWKLTQ